MDNSFVYIYPELDKLKLSFYPYQIRFKYPFKISHGIRESTDVVYVKLEHEDAVGWGEATLPPYLPETQKSVIDFLLNIDLGQIKVPFNPTEISKAINKGHPEYFKVPFRGFRGVFRGAAAAALDMALWNLKAQLEDKTIGELLGIQPVKFPLGTYTIGICSLDEMKLKVEDGIKADFELFKIKLDGGNDTEMIRNFRKLSDRPFAVDVNQGWKDVEEAIDKIKWLKEQGCILVEQPLQKDALGEMKRLKAGSVLPLYADESCQRLSDIQKLKDSFDGINIKLMKCGGITEAVQMISKARELDMKVLIGCMSESSVGCTSAAHLTPLADYADLDGPYLISNDPFEGMKIEKGRIALYPLAQKLSL